jgi:alpha-D-ribose 1-methylphosphonate 5-triphosphate diphosphatase PhnM
LSEARAKADTLEAFVAGTFRTFFTHVAGDPSHIAAVKRNDGLHVRVDTPEIVAGFAELRQDIEAAMTRGLLPMADSEFLTAAMIGVAFEIAEAMQRREGPPDVEGAVAFATALFLGGIDAAAKTVSE